MVAQTDVPVNAFAEIFVEGWRKLWRCAMWQAGRFTKEHLSRRTSPKRWNFPDKL